jgi:hypothetical protein
MMRRLLTVAVALAIPLFSAESAMACSCAPSDGLSIRDFDGVFIGRLLAVRVVDPPAAGEPIGSADPTDYIYRVGRVYNDGPGLRRGRRVRVRSVRSEASCGLPRRRGKLFGLFVDRRGGRWHGGLCGTVPPAQLRDAEAASAKAATPEAGSPGSAACG